MPSKTTMNPTRRDSRVRTRAAVEVSCSAWEGFVPLSTFDASMGGAFVIAESRELPQVGTKAIIRVGSLEIEGRVAHVLGLQQAQTTSARVTGFGVSFLRAQVGQWWLPPRAGEAGPPRGARPLEATSQASDAARALYAQGARLFDDSNYVQAKQKFAEAAALCIDPQVQAMLVVCSAFQYAGSGFKFRAQESFERALQLDPGSVEAKAGLEALLDKGR